VGIQGTKVSHTFGQNWFDRLSSQGVKLVTIEDDIFCGIWEDQPQRPSNPVHPHPEEYSGRSTANKVEEIRKIMSERSVDSLIIAALDEVACWVSSFFIIIFFKHNYVILYTLYIIIFICNTKQNVFTQIIIYKLITLKPKKKGC
jgi:hypothetical protein